MMKRGNKFMSRTMLSQMYTTAGFITDQEKARPSHASLAAATNDVAVVDAEVLCPHMLISTVSISTEPSAALTLAADDAFLRHRAPRVQDRIRFRLGSWRNHFLPKFLARPELAERHVIDN
jgi:hypothetical protein